MSLLKLHDRILDSLSERTVWENRQRVWRQMRSTGLRRIKPPWPYAADLHFPLVDGAISKFKPFYYNQIFQGERLAEFTGLSPELAPASESAADCFNWILRQETQFEKKIGTVNDFMLLGGRGVMKVRWDPLEGDSGRLIFEAIDPLFLIVPKGCDDEQEADWIVHVKQMTKSQYKRRRGYKQVTEGGGDITDLICGSSTANSNQDAAQMDKEVREGITYSSNRDVIIVWEVFEQTMNGWLMHTYSPSQPNMPLRKTVQCPYKMEGKPFCPFVSFQTEIKDEGWYSPRGVAELLAPFETSLCKLWNEKHDYMTFVNKPLFAADDIIPPNMANFRLGPGELLPKGIKPVVMPPLPIDIDQEMNVQRSTAEQYIQLPDAGIAPDETKGKRGGSDAVTATQVNYQASLASGGIDLRARIYRRSLATLYRMAWCILIFHRKEEIAYWCGQDRKVLPPQALSDNYRITPDGSPDSWDKTKRIARAMARRQEFKGDPAVNQDELIKDILSADDPRLIKRLFIGQDVAGQEAQEQQAVKILLMMEGRSVVVTPDDDHVSCIKEDMSWLQKQGQTGMPPNPVQVALVHQNIAQHVQALKQQNPAMAKQIEAELHQHDPNNQAQMPAQQPQPTAQAV